MSARRAQRNPRSGSYRKKAVKDKSQSAKLLKLAKKSLAKRFGSRDGQQHTTPIPQFKGL